MAFIGCGSLEITGGPAGDYPYEVALLVYDAGQGEVTAVETELDEGERPESPGGQLVGVETPFGTFVNPNFDFEGVNCSGAAGDDPAEGEPGDPRDRLDESSSLAPALQALGDGEWLVVNPGPQPLAVTWSVEDESASGQLSVPADDAEPFETQPGATVVIESDGEVIAEATGPGADEAALSNLTLVALGDGAFGVINTMDRETTFTWSVEGVEATSTATVDANNMTTIETDGDGPVSVSINGTPVAEATPVATDFGGADGSGAGDLPTVVSLVGLLAAAGLVVHGRE